MTVCQKNLHQAQELQKQAHIKGFKPKSYVPDDKVWLNSKSMKIKHNRKLKAKFFRPFQVLHLVGKQTYKLEFPQRWRIHNVFYVSFLEQNITRRERVDKQVTKLEAGDSKEYELAAIQDSAVYANKSELGQLSGLYYMVA